jgi:acyl CoA:acetate/3-ketoacid CoA transferase beta subunit
VSASASRAEICITACAEAWRGDGEILASAIGVVPRIAAGLARLTFEPDLLVTDGQAYLLAEPAPIDVPDGRIAVEGWLPYRRVFDILWSGRRHVMMGAAQIDRYGNTNISCIGDWKQPSRQLIGVRGAPGNSVCHPCSYWIPSQSARVFVERVDFVSGVGGDAAHEIRLVVTDLAVYDFRGPGRTMRVRSLHPGVMLDDVHARSGFEMAVADDLGETRAPTDEELRLIRDVLDPADRRSTEVRAA